MYNLLLSIVRFLLFFPIIWPKKYQIWLFEQKKILKHFHPNCKKVIWIHCSSLGEYEHIKALIKPLKKINPIINITFFSPSGYNYFRDFDTIEQISYLPLDTKYAMRKFIHLMNPMMVIIAKNEIWPNMITEINNENIPLYLIGCKLKLKKINNWFLKKYYKKYLTKFSHIFCEDITTYNFLQSNNISKSSIVQNTRINQILIDSKKEFNNQQLHQFTKNKKTIIYGSIEKSDFPIIIDTINTQNDVNHIIVPHETNNTIIDALQKIISEKYILYSKIESEELKNVNTLIINEFGILKKLYKYADIAYIGGGFNKGVHNTLEPAVYGNMLFFGPNHTNFPETFFFVEKKIAISINDKTEFNRELNNYLANTYSKEEILSIINIFFTSKNKNLNSIILKLQEYIKD